jgi:formylglycine-generating enzyme required for sulfatase activity
MGSEGGVDADMKPAHQVELDGFWIGRTEVTIGQWRSVMGSVPGTSNDQGENHPAVEVSWDDCQSFCRQAGPRLPTQAQWEYAAGGAEGRQYPWGNERDSARCQPWDDRHGHERTAPVGSFPAGASWCGALDMAGNVWDWCQDWYQDRFYESAAAGRRNPECTEAGSRWRVLRGGHWSGNDFCCRSATRFSSDPGTGLDFVGFRVAGAR